MDEAVIAEWARKAGMTLPSGTDVIHGWSDMEVGYDVREHHGRVAFDNVQRGQRRILATFAHVEDADRMLLLELALAWRSRERMPQLQTSEYAPGVRVEVGPTTITLEWDGGDAEFSTGLNGQYNSKRYSYVAGRSAEEIEAAMNDAHGRPLFAA